MQKDKSRPIISMLNKAQWRLERMIDVRILSASQRPRRMGYPYETQSRVCTDRGYLQVEKRSDSTVNLIVSMHSQAFDMWGRIQGYCRNRLTGTDRDIFGWVSEQLSRTSYPPALLPALEYRWTGSFTENSAAVIMMPNFPGNRCSRIAFFPFFPFFFRQGCSWKKKRPTPIR